MGYAILHTEASTGWGGQEKRILDEILYLRERGHRFYLACQPDSKILVEARKKGVECLAVKMPNPVAPAAIAALRRFICINKIEVVNTHSSKDSWLIGFTRCVTRIPLVVRTRHLSTPVTNKFVYTRMTDHIVTTAESIKSDLVKIGIPPGKACSIPTGVNPSRFDPEKIDRARAREQLGLADGEIAVGNIGILRSWKGFPDFLEAARRIADRNMGVRFFIAGDGPRREEIEGLISEKNLERVVTMLGYREDTPEILAALDIFLFTSYANEGVPQAVLQALAMGKAVVGTDIGGVAEAVIDGRTGFLVRPRDVDGMTSGVRKLVEDEPLLRSFGAAGRDLVLRNFTIAQTCERMLEVYRKGLADKGL
ncbi:MAG TPA: glycosyltransferase family 4 protein [bacterium]|nr:glycosyltransferase family 4 protein [bacterium]